MVPELGVMKISGGIRTELYRLLRFCDLSEFWLINWAKYLGPVQSKRFDFFTKFLHVCADNSCGQIVMKRHWQVFLISDVTAFKKNCYVNLCFKIVERVGFSCLRKLFMIAMVFAWISPSAYCMLQKCTASTLVF